MTDRTLRMMPMILMMDMPEPPVVAPPWFPVFGLPVLLSPVDGLLVPVSPVDGLPLSVVPPLFPPAGG